ncbi:MAG: vanadium-dependent haloperoxidase [Planctomycetota bacterium]
MRNTRNFGSTVARAAALAVGLVIPIAASADVVLDWNTTASEVLATNTSLQNPGAASRSMAMVNLAIYDAFAMTEDGSTMFYDYGGGHASPGYNASSKAAAATAAYEVLSGIYPDQQSTLDAQLMSSLSSVPLGADRDEGVALGQMIGRSIVDRRANDGWDSSVQYTPTDAIGRWQPDPTITPTQEAWGPSWGDVDLFALPDTERFMPPPMPWVDTPEYADAYNEVKVLGAADSTERTADQTEIGLFWAYDREGLGTPMKLYNEALRTIAVQEGNTAKENAELFAKATVAMADAGVVAWQSKFEYDFWRPVTGIREGDFDGNPLTIGDADWTPLGAPGGTGQDFTPPFPTYLSGHATFGGAVFQALAEFYGGDDLDFTLESEELPGVTRDFTSLSQAMAENGRSRVYLGIHWNFDDTEAQIVGSDIATHLFSSRFISAASIPEPHSVLLLITPLLAMRRRAV